MPVVVERMFPGQPLVYQKFNSKHRSQTASGVKRWVLLRSYGMMHPIKDVSLALG
jgi:hypothetical protein